MVGLGNVTELTDGFAGEVVRPDDPGYDAARAVWNSMIDRRPALIVRPTGTDDVVTALRFAREQNLIVAIRCGGHSIPGFSTCDDGIVIDLSLMRGVEVDPTTRTARVRGGSLLAELDDAAQEHGLVCPVGVVSHTGVAGLTLGGGMGRLQCQLGLTIDSLLAVELVTADGRVVRASEHENPELFWGMRGAGANFGIVTSFEMSMPQADLTVHLMTKVVRELNLHTRFAGLSLGGNEGAPSAGLDLHLADRLPARSALPTASPKTLPSLQRQPHAHRGRRRLLLWVASIGTDIGLPQTKLPSIVLGTPGVRLAQPPAVFIPVGTPGIDHAGQMVRCDNVVSLPLKNLGRSTLPRPPTSWPPSKPPSNREPRAMLIKFTGGKVYDPQQRQRRGSRHLRRTAASSPTAPGARVDKEYVAARPRRHGRRHRPAQPHRRRQGDHRPHAAAGGPPAGRGRAHGADARGHRPRRAVDHDHRLPLRRDGLHGLLRAGHAARQCAPGAPRDGRHADDRQGRVRHARQRRFLPAHALPRRSRLRVDQGLHRLDHARRAGDRGQGGQPGGISAFKFNQRKLDLDEKHVYYGITPRDIILTLARGLMELGVTHPLHVHGCNLGIPGNVETTLATIRATEGLPMHLTHIQFHSYATEGDRQFSSGAAQIADLLTKYPNISIDVGQVMFGQTCTASGDSMRQYNGSKNADPKRWVVMDIECDAGCGVVPFRYRDKSYVNALQWAIGLETFLLVEDPWRIFLTTDHPNGAPFYTYPHLIRLLMDRGFRRETMQRVNQDALKYSTLPMLEREYSLYEIAIMTRAGPARSLGLKDLGHVGPGATRRHHRLQGRRQPRGDVHDARVRVQERRAHRA